MSETEERKGEYPRRRTRPRPRAWTAEEIAELRAGLGMTQAGLAEKLGVRQQTVSEWETGRYQPRGASARMLSMVAEERGARPES